MASQLPSPFSPHSLASRRRFLRQGGLFLGGVALAGTVNACSTESTPQADTGAAPQANANAAPASSGGKALRVGYQKSAAALGLLKNQGKLADRLKYDGAEVTWNEFVAGPQMLEALNVGSIDVAYVGETPPIFAQAAGAPLLYVAYEPAGPKAEAILVPQDSPIQTVADLKGKRVALNKGSNVHYLLVKALEEAGLTYSDIESAYLAPGDARPAFEQKNVDAWVIWDPYLAAAEKDLGARTLRNGEGLVENRSIYLATQSFAQNQPELLNSFVEEVKEINTWIQGNLGELVTFLSSELGIPEDVLELSEGRRGWGVQPITDDVVAYQQDIADVFYDLQIIPQKLDVSSVIWQG